MHPDGGAGRESRPPEDDGAAGNSCRVFPGNFIDHPEMSPLSASAYPEISTASNLESGTKCHFNRSPIVDLRQSVHIN
ncbi:hypothetical protein [Burkholderia plantarii]|uniref:hypothetical protein n=1 Tax=Burkholderia plantarii TaxID=41899 RepID=UPI000A84D6D0|nr:hypothetical protein [Burkholderia plantarii]